MTREKVPSEKKRVAFNSSLSPQNIKRLSACSKRLGLPVSRVIDVLVEAVDLDKIEYQPAKMIL